MDDFSSDRKFPLSVFRIPPNPPSPRMWRSALQRSSWTSQADLCPDQIFSLFWVPSLTLLPGAKGGERVVFCFVLCLFIYLFI